MKRLHKRFLLATFCALFTATLQAADVTITVNGRVVAKPCTIQTKEANVNLGDLSQSATTWFCIWLAQYYFVINRLSG
ncbi:TPA: type 1 fimbrial protein [Escherichia coli]|nr:fimbrial protein [Escherichia coli]HAH9031174.1 type 1 fimbrial protein [Escherichia coli]